METNKRLRHFARWLSKQDVEAYLIASLTDIRYLTGFSGSAALLIITKTRPYFITDFRYRDQSQAEVKSCEIIIATNNPFDSLTDNKLLNRTEILGIDRDNTSLTQFEELTAFHPKKNIKSVPNPVAEFRLVKDREEIACLEKACQIIDKVFQDIVSIIRPGMTEIDVSAEISYRCKKEGGSGDAFDIIVAGGPLSALPHGIAGDNTLKDNELVVLDFGCIYEGYHSDITRTIALSDTTRQQRDMYHTVREAQEKALMAARSGIKASSLDAVARDSITERGYGEFFGHSLGHGLGLEIHEAPRLSTTNHARLKAGMVCTIEPGVYVPDVGGVRIEDVVLLSRNGATVLTHAPKDFIVI